MPVLTSPDGTTFRTENPSEVVRLKARGYTEGTEPVTTFADTQFHPHGKSVGEVQAYIAEHPEDARRVIAEEKAGKARSTIIGE